MPIDYQLQNIEKELSQMSTNIQAVDMESVKERTLKRVAERMSWMVRQAVFESSIKSPASKISPYESGDGPPLVTNDAWLFKKTGANRYSVFPHKDVRQRAMVLNFGYPGMIRPTNDEYLRFTVDGVPVFRKEVEGPDAIGYWQAAFQKMQNSDKLQEIANEELDAEFEEKF